MQQSSINEKHTQAQGMWFQLLKKQKKKYKKYKNSVVSRTEGKRESKNRRVWANTTESRNWTNQRRKLELTCIRGPQETEVSANGAALQDSCLKAVLRCVWWGCSLYTQVKRPQSSVPQHPVGWSPTSLHRRDIQEAASPWLRKYWLFHLKHFKT